MQIIYDPNEPTDSAIYVDKFLPTDRVVTRMDPASWDIRGSHIEIIEHMYQDFKQRLRVLDGLKEDAQYFPDSKLYLDVLLRRLPEDKRLYRDGFHIIKGYCLQDELTGTRARMVMEAKDATFYRYVDYSNLTIGFEPSSGMDYRWWSTYDPSQWAEIGIYEVRRVYWKNKGLSGYPEREEIAQALHDAGILAEVSAPPDARQLTDEERDEFGRVPPGTPTATEIISDDR